MESQETPAPDQEPQPQEGTSEPDAAPDEQPAPGEDSPAEPDED